jgi:type II secretory pathway component GspD/PulD (secretin)
MLKRAQRWLVPAALVALGWSLSAAALVAAPVGSGTGDSKKAEGPAERVRKALDQTTDVVIENQPLEAAVGILAEQTKLNFVFDRLTIQQLGVDLVNPPAAPVTVRLQQVKVRTALRSMLGQYNLSYAIIGEAVIITSEDMAMHRQMKQRVSVDLDGVQLATGLKQLAKETATNLLVDSRVSKEAQAPVTLQLDDVPLETAVRLMAEAAGLKPVRVGNVLYVTNKANAAELRADQDLAPMPQPGQPQALEDIIIGGGAVPARAIPAAPPAPPATAPADKPPPPPDKEKPPEEKEKKSDDKKPSEDKPKPPDDKKPAPGDKP